MADTVPVPDSFEYLPSPMSDIGGADLVAGPLQTTRWVTLPTERDHNTASSVWRVLSSQGSEARLAPGLASVRWDTLSSRVA